jgi:ferrous iron transport protein A
VRDLIDQDRDLVPLDRLAAGRCAEIDRFEGCPEHIHRLEEMGLRRGTTVEVVRCGRPCILRVGGNRVCFRRSDLLSVLVRTRGSAVQ